VLGKENGTERSRKAGMNRPTFVSRNPEGLTQSRPLNHRLRFWLSVLLIVIVLLLIRSYYASSTQKSHAPLPPPVVLSVAQTKDVPVYLSGLGNVIPTYSVTVKTQINGQLLRVLFKEGQMVKAGDLLAEIDPRPYQAQLVQYEGQLARDMALLANAKIDLQRYKTLWRQDSVAKQTYDTQTSVVQQDEGTVKIDEGLIQSTKLNLLYTEITSPVDGRVGLRLVDPGNYVQVSDTTGLAVIDTINPITVVFTLPEDNIPEVSSQVYANKTLIVKAYDRSQNKLLSTGTLLTIDNQIDPTTGTVKLKAQFKNDDNHLFPNQFVNVKLLVNTLKNAVTVPTAAIQQGTAGGYVYVLNADNTVSMIAVVSSVTEGTETVVTSGLSAGQSVVTEGTDKLADGMKVTVATGDIGDNKTPVKKTGKNRHSSP
jgi:multidrug efflux system membrane fusion protein